MKWPLAASLALALALAGCADSGSFDREKPVKLVASTGHILPSTEQNLPPTKPVQPRPHPSTAEASKPGANESSSLMECVSDACKVQCSPAIEKHSRPKGCLYFKEPNDRHAVIAPSDIQRNGRE
jgi:hypothetical protein